MQRHMYQASSSTCRIKRISTTNETIQQVSAEMQAVDFSDPLQQADFCSCKICISAVQEVRRWNQNLQRTICASDMSMAYT